MLRFLVRKLIKVFGRNVVLCVMLCMYLMCFELLRFGFVLI